VSAGRFAQITVIIASVTISPAHPTAIPIMTPNSKSVPHEGDAVPIGECTGVTVAEAGAKSSNLSSWMKL
jgi:hypothetical protein